VLVDEVAALPLPQRALILALTFSYSLRFSSNRARRGWRAAVCDALEVESVLMGKTFLVEQAQVIARMQTRDWPALAASHATMQENVFVSLVCILTRMPLFIVGSPGASKSTAVALLRSNLLGPNSVDEFFRALPAISMYTHVGSAQATSDGLLSVFARARRNDATIRAAGQGKSHISVVLLEELGVTDSSPLNPCKVLHAQLDPQVRFKCIGVCEEGERTYDCALLQAGRPPLAVIGISNTLLDESKMSRALFLHCIPPDEKTLSNAAISIATHSHLRAQHNLAPGAPAVPRELDQQLELLFEATAAAYVDFQRPREVSGSVPAEDGVAAADRVPAAHNLPISVLNRVVTSTVSLRDYYGLAHFAAASLAGRPASTLSAVRAIMEGVQLNFCSGTGEGLDQTLTFFGQAITSHVMRAATKLSYIDDAVHRALGDKDNEDLRTLARANAEAGYDDMVLQIQQGVHAFLTRPLDLVEVAERMLLQRAVTARHMLVVTDDPPGAFEFIRDALCNGREQVNSDLAYVTGSSFAGDLIEAADYELVGTVMSLMEREPGGTAIMWRAGRIYEALYELFNNSVYMIKDVAFVRVAMGATATPYSRLSTGFRAVVVVSRAEFIALPPAMLSRMFKVG
jgi:hypothetical protein